MKKILLKMAEPGMKLAKPVTNDRGMILCGEATVLTAEIIARLQRMEVNQIAIKGHAVKKGGAKKSLEEQMHELNARFSRIGADPLMNKVKDLFAKQITEGADEP
jgi:hypothetical protein